MKKSTNLIGVRFTRLVVISRTFDKRINRPVWECLCDCGNKKLVTSSDLTHGRIKSCGCLHRDNTIKRNFKHGLKKHPLYCVWQDMKKRCYDKKDKGFTRYGGRGIIVCDEWKNSPQSFIEWAVSNGYSSGLQIDRIDNNKGYSPENCRWVTCAENCRNKRTNVYIEHNGKKLVLEDWARMANRDGYAFKKLVEKYGIEKALSMPKRQHRYIECRGVRKTLTEWANEVGIGVMTLICRLKKYPAEVAIFTPVGKLGKHEQR